jgi:cell division protein ZapA
MPELIPANIVIADRTYRLKIEPADEEKLRKTVKFINEKIMEFKTMFAGKDMQDYISMAFLWFATEQTDNAAGAMGMAGVSEKLLSIEALLDKALTTNS